jgi:hypothetical protein
MGVAKTPWLLLGTPCRCLGVPPAVQPDLDALLQGFPRREPAAGEAAEGVEFRVEQAAGATFLAGGGCRWDLTGSADPLSSHIEYRLVDGAVRRARDRWVLHAGAVEAPGGTCLIVGESGAGKTSLTLWLWAGGLRLGTDDLCPLRHGSLLPEVFPRALHMDARYSPRLLERIPPRPDAYPADYYPFPGPGREPLLSPISRLLVLERGPRPEGELERLPQSEAVNALLKATIRTAGFDFGRAWEDMHRLASQCQTYRLRAATPEGAGEQAMELLGN